MGLNAFLSWLFFRSALVSRLYHNTVFARARWRRWFGFGFIAILFTARTARQFLVAPPVVAAGVLLAAATALLGLVATLVLLIAASATVAVLAVQRLPDDAAGHRLGAEGFDGALCENTLEALRALVQRDAASPLEACPYIETDVQETADGQLVLLHDLTLGRAFPRAGANAAPIAALEAPPGAPPFALTTVADLTLAQLQGLHLGGRRGLRVPTLRALLEACAELGVRRPLAIEVKVLRTDAARQQLLEDLSWYLSTRGAALEADASAAPLRHPHLGWAGVIAFPHFFSRCFGEYGSSQWRHWAAEFRRRGIPARSCHFTQLTLVYHGS